MNPFRSRLVLLLVTLVCGLSAFVQAGDAPVDWFDHGFGSSIVVAESLEGDDKILLMHGYLTLPTPRAFNFSMLPGTCL